MWPAERPSSVKGLGNVIELVKLGEVLVFSGPKEPLGSDMQPCPSALDSKLSLEMSDSTENVEVFAACMMMWRPCLRDLNACK